MSDTNRAGAAHEPNNESAWIGDDDGGHGVTARTCVVVQHLSAEPAGTFGPTLERLGYSISPVFAWDLAARRDEAVRADLLLVMGGPIGVYDQADFPFIAAELEVMRARAAADAATLGACLGCQLLASALGGVVYPGDAGFELGWGAVDLTDDGQTHPIARAAGDGAPVLHWHGDTFDLPPGARLLASTPRYRNQAFALGRRQLGLQFHIETDAAELEDWLVTFSADLRRLDACAVAELRRANLREAPGLARRSADFLEAWLAQL